jgi:hypothetical protein
MARYFQVNKSTIYDIRAMRRWRHVAPAEKAIPLSKLKSLDRLRFASLI